MGKQLAGSHFVALAACGLVVAIGCGDEEGAPVPGRDAPVAETRDGVSAETRGGDTGDARDGAATSEAGSPGDAPAMPADAVDAPVDQPVVSTDASVPACGRTGGACCPLNVCADGCCVDGRCLAEGIQCGAFGGVCSKGGCVNGAAVCGRVGRPCCNREACTASRTVCEFVSLGQALVCLPCGGDGERCCKGEYTGQGRCGSGLSCDSRTSRCRPCPGCEGSDRWCDGNGRCVTCGQPNGGCCPGDVCAGGGCCFEGRCLEPNAACRSFDNVRFGMCLAGRCACGGQGQPCCPGQRCNDLSLVCRTPPGGGTGFICSSACGGEGEPCCPGAVCSEPTLFCRVTPGVGPSSCQRCGEPGRPCCPGDQCNGGGCCERDWCVAAGDACRGVGGTCEAGQCCGQEGKRCCWSRLPNGLCGSPSTLRCDLGTASTPDTCRPCGGPGQRCCAGQRCREGCCGDARCIAVGQTCPLEGGTCSAGGACGDCGGRGQPCCRTPSFVYCTSPWTNCDAQGGQGSPVTYVCGGCGKLGERCCDSAGLNGAGQGFEGLCEGNLRCDYDHVVDRYACVSP